MTGPEPIRLAVPGATFATWRRTAPGLAVPPGLEPLVPRPDRAALPTAVATAFGVHGEADVVASLRYSRGDLELGVHCAVAGDLAAAVVQMRHEVTARTVDWVQVVLLGAPQAPSEMVSWLPDPGSSTAGARLRVVITVETGHRPSPAEVELARWEGRFDGWFDNGRPADLDELRETLRSALVGQASPGSGGPGR